MAHATAGDPALHIAERLGCHRSHVYRTTARFVAHGFDGLLDRRQMSKRRIADEAFDRCVRACVDKSPEDFGYPRPTWTRELLVRVAETLLGVRVSLTLMSRVLSRIRARRGRPKPVVRCPLSQRQQRRRLCAIRDLCNHLGPNEVAVYEDEADIHLNPKIGLDWMNHGCQKQVVTPGKNEKAYVAGTLDIRSGTVLWVGENAKNSALFIKMMKVLDAHYATATCIHVILDNYGIHSSHETKRALAPLARIKLHFLPSYSPDHNRIERLWQDLHANVTRNHRHRSLESLCRAVATWLDGVSPWPSRLAMSARGSSTVRCPNRIAFDSPRHRRAMSPVMGR